MTIKQISDMEPQFILGLRKYRVLSSIITALVALLIFWDTPNTPSGNLINFQKSLVLGMVFGLMGAGITFVGFRHFVSVGTEFFELHKTEKERNAITIWHENFTEGFLYSTIGLVAMTVFMIANTGEHGTVWMFLTTLTSFGSAVFLRAIALSMYRWV